MKLFWSKLAFPALYLAFGLAVFGVSYTLLGQGPGSGDNENQGPVGGVDDPSETPVPNPTPGGPGAGEEVGPVGQVNELFDVLVGGDVPELKQLLEEGADPNAINEDGVTALQWTVLGAPTTATVYGQVQALLTAGANPNMTSGNGWTALHWAAKHGAGEAVAQALIDRGAGVDITDTQGVSALHLAALFGNDGVRSAIEAVTPTRPPEYEKLKALGGIAKRLKAAGPEAEVRTIFASELNRLVELGVFSEEEKEAILLGIEQAQAGCDTCD